jgi:hypothetical protein
MWSFGCARTASILPTQTASLSVPSTNSGINGEIIASWNFIYNATASDYARALLELGKHAGFDLNAAFRFIADRACDSQRFVECSAKHVHAVWSDRPDGRFRRSGMLRPAQRL